MIFLAGHDLWIKVPEVISLLHFTFCIQTKFYSDDLKEENSLGEMDLDVRIILTFRLLMSYIYIYGAPILDVSRSRTTTQHSR